MKTGTQNSVILNHLMNIGPITQHIAIEKYGIYCLAARIRNLKDKGYLIESEYIEVRTRYGNGVTHVKQYSYGGEA